MNRIISIMIYIIFLVSCGAITRKDWLTQTVKITDISTHNPIHNAMIIINGKVIGKTDDKGIFVHQVKNPNEDISFKIQVKHPLYNTLDFNVEAKPGGQFIAGGVALFLLGIIPGAVSLGIDGGTGTWYTYKKQIELQMNAN